MTVQVGSKWVAKTDEPWSSGVFMGDEVVIDSILHNDVQFVDRDGTFWYGSLKNWQDHMEPIYTPKAIVDTKDNVNNPAHYGQGKIEAIEYIEDFLTEEEYQGYLRGNIAKYLHRWPWKGKPVEDLKKARVYLDWLIKVVEDAQTPPDT